MERVGQKKILYIVTQGNFGGAQKYVFDLASALNKEGFGVTVAAGKSGDRLKEKLEREKINFVRINNLVRQINPIFDIAGFFEIYKLVKKLKPDIVHLNSSKAGIVGAVAAKLAGVKKVIFTVHGLVLNEPLSKIHWWLYYVAHKFAGIFTDDFIAVSKVDAEECIRLGLKEKRRVTIIPICIDLTKYEFEEKDEARKNLENYAGVNFGNNPVIGTIADFYPSKGLEYLIKAANIVTASHPKVNFLIIGREGPVKEKILDLIKNEGLAQNIYTFSLEDAWKQLKGFDVFVLPSIKEGFPYTILEAMLAQLPIVATNVGGIPLAINNGRKTGILVPPADPEKLAWAINEILSDPYLAKRLGDQAWLDMQVFSMYHMLDATKKIYIL